MTCPPIDTYVGTSQQLRYGSGGNLITVTLGIGNFRVGEGDGLLGTLGYDRTPDPEYRRTTRRATLGTPCWQGPSHNRPEVFRWQLQGLTDTQYFSLLAMIDRQQRDKGRVLLIDQRWALHEPTPRTRAKVGNTLTAMPGMVAYFAQFYVELEELSVREYRNTGSHGLELAGKEMDKVLLTEDL